MQCLENATLRFSLRHHCLFGPACPKLSPRAGEWGQGDGLGEYLTRQHVEVHDLKATGKTPVW